MQGRLFGSVRFGDLVCARYLAERSRMFGQARFGYLAKKLPSVRFGSAHRVLPIVVAEHYRTFGSVRFGDCPKRRALGSVRFGSTSSMAAFGSVRFGGPCRDVAQAENAERSVRFGSAISRRQLCSVRFGSASACAATRYGSARFGVAELTQHLRGTRPTFGSVRFGPMSARF